MTRRRDARALAAVVLAAGLAAGWAGAAGEGIVWRPHWRTALEAAKKSRKPALLYLHVAGSIPCDNMQGYTLRDRELVRLAEQFECAGVDAQRDHSFAQKVLARDLLDKYNTLEASELLAGAAPTVFFFSPDGEELYRVHGFVSAPDLVAKMHLVLDLTAAREKLARDPADTRALAEAGHLYLELDVPDAAESYLHEALQSDREDKLGLAAGVKLDLAIIALKREKLDEALELIVGVLSEHREFERYCEARYYLGLALLGKDRRAEALAVLAELGDYPPGKARDTRCAKSKWAEYARGLIERLEQPDSGKK